MYLWTTWCKNGLSTKKVIIIGGAGFLGSHIAQVLSAADGVELTYADVVPNPDLNASYLPVDLLEPSTLTELGDFSVVINCTGQVTQPFNLCYRLNTEGTQNLLGSLRDTPTRVIHVSTTAVYGSAEHCDESSPLNPETNYATVKAVAEFQLQDGLESSKLTILRLSNLYGPGQQKGIAAYLLRSNGLKRQLYFNNDGTLVRSFLHVQDAARVISRCVMESTLSGIYNVKGDDTYTVKGLIEAFEREFDVVFDKEFSNSSPWENIKVLDDSRIRKAIDLEYEHNILSHFRQMAENPRHG